MIPDLSHDKYLAKKDCFCCIQLMGKCQPYKIHIYSLNIQINVNTQKKSSALMAIYSISPS